MVEAMLIVLNDQRQTWIQMTIFYDSLSLFLQQKLIRWNLVLVATLLCLCYIFWGLEFLWELSVREVDSILAAVYISGDSNSINYWSHTVRDRWGNEKASWWYLKCIASFFQHLCWGKCATPREQEAPLVFYHFHLKHVSPIIQFFAAELFSSLLAKNCSTLGSQSISDFRSHAKQCRSDALHVDVKGFLLAFFDN